MAAARRARGGGGHQSTWSRSSYIPFAIATAVNLSTPLVLAVLAVLLLRRGCRLAALERGRLGFVGVLMVIQPQPGDLNVWTWVGGRHPFIGASRDVLARWVPPRRADAGRVAYSAVTLAVVGLRLGALLEGWQPMSLRGAAASSLGSSLLLARATSC